MFRDSDECVVDAAVVTGYHDVVDFKKSKSCRYRSALVTIKEGLSLRQVKRICGGNIKQITTGIKPCIFSSTNGGFYEAIVSHTSHTTIERERLCMKIVH